MPDYECPRSHGGLPLLIVREASIHCINLILRVLLTCAPKNYMGQVVLTYMSRKLTLNTVLQTYRGLGMHLFAILRQLE